MNKRALDYFAGNKGLMIGFIACLVICVISNYIYYLFPRPNPYFFQSFTTPSNYLYITLVVTAVGILLDFNKNTLLVLLVYNIFFLVSIYLRKIPFDTFEYTDFINIVVYLSLIMALFAIIFKKRGSNKFKKIFILSVTLPVVCIIIFFVCAQRKSFGTISYGLTIIAFATSLILLWLPLEKINICPKCGFKNKNDISFCGGCGNKLN